MVVTGDLSDWRNPTHSTIRFAPQATLEWLHSGRIAMFAVGDTTPTTIDAWVTRTLMVVKDWPADRPLLFIQDWSACQFQLVGYIRDKIRKLGALCARWRTQATVSTGRVAVVLPDTLIGQMVKVFFKPVCDAYVPLPCRFFTSQEAALGWINEVLTAPERNGV